MKYFFTPNSSTFRKSRGEEEEVGENAMKWKRSNWWNMCLLGDTCKIPDKRDRPKRIKVITRAMKIMNNKFNKNETIKKNE